MSECFLTVEGFDYLIDGDLKWLLNQKRDLERDHIETIIKHYYKLMTGNDYDQHIQENKNQSEIYN